MSNPFEAIAEAYEEQTEELDKRGYADKFKRCAELFFEEVNDDVLPNEPKFQFEDIEYLDGYFIFSHGTNSVVHFHIKECPGWKFGIWWEMPNEKESDGKRIKGECFAQYENEIDKFKPCTSEIRATISVIFDNPEPIGCFYKALRMLQFIRDEPYLAFCRHLYAWNYNEEYHTREEAEREYKEHQRQMETEEMYIPVLNEKVLKFVREKILPCFNNAEIIEDEPYSSPKYKVIAPCSKNTDIIEKPGFYSWFEYDDLEGKELENELNFIEIECRAFAKGHGFIWYPPIDHDIYFFDEDTSEGKSNDS